MPRASPKGKNTISKFSPPAGNTLRQMDSSSPSRSSLNISRRVLEVQCVIGQPACLDDGLSMKKKLKDIVQLGVQGATREETFLILSACVINEEECIEKFVFFSGRKNIFYSLRTVVISVEFSGRLVQHLHY